MQKHEQICTLTCIISVCDNKRMPSMYLLETTQRISGIALWYTLVYSLLPVVISIHVCVPLVDMKLQEEDVTFRSRLLMSVSTK